MVKGDALIDIVCNDIFDTRFQYLGNGQWIHSNAYGTDSFAVEDAEENDRMLRLIYEKAGENAFSGSSYLASVIDGEFTIDRSSPYSGTKISEDQKTANSEAIMLLPPQLMNGAGMPLVGMLPETTAILMAA